MNCNWNWGIFFDASPEGNGTYADMLLSGLMWTIVTALCAWVIAVCLGSVIGVLRTLPSKTANAICQRAFALQMSVITVAASLCPDWSMTWARSAAEVL